MADIAIQRVSKHFALGNRRMTAIDDLSLSLRSGGFYALIGPSGCGKSTLLRLIADLMLPDAGVIAICGRQPREARLRHEIGFVFQEASLLPWRSVLDNVRLPREIAGRGRGGASSAEELIRLVGLQGFETARPAQLSGGMQQRVSIARALALRPKVLLLDEPFGALDEITRQRLNMELLRIWSETGTTAVLVTHTIGEAVFMADRVHVLAAHPGRLVTSIDIDLPRPRTLALMQTTGFNHLENAVRAALFGGDLVERDAVLD